MKKLLIILTLIIFSCQKPLNKIKIDGELKKWHKIVFNLNTEDTSEFEKDNPFLNYRLVISFSNGDSTIKVPGFYAADGNAAESSSDSGGIWKVIFRPDKIGVWNYEVSFQKGKDIAIKSYDFSGSPLPHDGLKGSFEIYGSDKKGKDFRAKGRIINGNKGYFKFSENNSFFIKNGTDSPENFLAYSDFDQTYRYQIQNRDGESNPEMKIHDYKSHIGDWKIDDPLWKKNKGKAILGAVNYLADKGINSIYMITLNIQADGKDVWPYSNHNERYRFDCSKLDQWEILFDHMQKKGILIHLLTQETENETLLDNGDTEVQRKLYLRELSARFGHHLGIIWNMGEENGPADWSPIGQTDEQRIEMGDYLKSINPYNPIIFLHSHSNDHHQDLYLTPLLGENSYDGASMQIADPKKVNSRIKFWINKSISSDKKWIVNLDEIGPHWKGVLPDAFDIKHDTIRHHGLWGSLLAGAGGVEWYFGWKFPNADLTCEDFRSRDLWWDQSSIATKFISQFPLEKMDSTNELVKTPYSFCLSKKDDLYLIYFPSKSNTFEVKLLNNKFNYSIAWFNPRIGGEIENGSITSISGGGFKRIGKPPYEINKDWVAIIKKK